VTLFQTLQDIERAVSPWAHDLEVFRDGAYLAPLEVDEVEAVSERDVGPPADGKFAPACIREDGVANGLVVCLRVGLKSIK